MERVVIKKYDDGGCSITVDDKTWFFGCEVDVEDILEVFAALGYLEGDKNDDCR